MKKFLSIVFVVTLFFLSINQSEARGPYGGGYRYQDGGLIYTNVALPELVSKDINSSKNLPLDELRKGESYSRNILGLIDIGDAGIHAAMKNGNIEKLYYADTKISKVYIPLLFLPVYIKEYKTTVYGE